MNKQMSVLNFKSFVAAAICFLAVSNVFAASSATDQLTYSLVVKNLSTKLKTDLAKTDVSVKLSNLKQHSVSKTEVVVNGDGLAVLPSDDNQLPIRFEAKINVAQKTVSNISYDFVEAASVSEYAPTSNEEILMKELMKQISKDYKTDNIVIALDGVEDNSNLREKAFTGVGEVRIGDLVWNKINFDVVFDASGKATKVAYAVKK